MIFVILFSFILAENNICICKNECSSSCSKNSFIVQSNQNFQNFINQNFNNTKEIALNLYSKYETFYFNLDLSYFSNTKLQLRTQSDSYPVVITLQNSKFSNKQITLKPNQQVTLPQYDYHQNQKVEINNLYQVSVSSKDDALNQENNLSKSILLDPKDEILKKKILNNNSSKYHKDTSPDQTILDNPDGLINTSSHFMKNINGWKIGFNSEADEGSFSTTANGVASFTFNGTKIHIFAYKKTDSCNAEITIDNKVVGTYNFHSNPAKHEVIFSSDDLQFGEHTMKIKHMGQNQKSIVIASLLYDPLPKIGGFKLGFDDFVERTGEWTQDGLKFSSTSDAASGKFKFHGTRFWLTGVKKTNNGGFSLQIDDEQLVSVSDSLEAEELKVQDQYFPALLYQSDVLDLGDHTVTITKGTTEISLVNFMYSTQPYNGVFVPANEMDIKDYWREESGGYSSDDKYSIIEYSSYFNHFWVLGNKAHNIASLKVYYDNELADTVVTKSIVTHEHTSDLLLSYTAKESSSNYRISLEHGGSSIESDDEENLHISYCYYVNDKEITVEGGTYTINFASAEAKKEGTWIEETEEGSSDKNVYSDEKGSSVTVTYRGSYFYLSCSMDPSYGRIEIIIDGKKINSISLYHEKHKGNCVMYKSPALILYGDHKLTIVNQDGKRVSLHQLKFYQFPTDGKTAPSLVGLINYKCEIFGNDNAPNVNSKCVDDERVGIISYLNENGKSAWYNFVGTKVHVFALRGPNSPKISIAINNKNAINLDLYSDTVRSEIVYSSNDLPFGLYPITVKVIEKRKDSENFLISFFVDPLQKIGGYKLGYEDRISQTGEWILADENTPVFSSNSNDASITFSFHGTRFWLTGIRSNNVGNFLITVDGKEEQVSKSFSDKEGTYFSEGNKAVLLYESAVLELSDHTVTIKRTNSEIKLVNLLYTTKPYDSSLIGVDEMEKKGSWEPEESGSGYYSKDQNSVVEFSRYSKEFWILGDSKSNNASMNIYLNEQLESTIKTNEVKTETSSNDILLSHINKDTLTKYRIKLEHGGSSVEEAKEKVLHISYCYYLNEKSMDTSGQTETIGISSMTRKTGTWNEIEEKYKNGNSDARRQILSTEEKGASITVDFTGCEFYISSRMEPSYGNIDIILDGKEIDSVSLYHEKSQTSSIVYKSPQICGTHTLTISNHDSRPVSIFEIKHRQLQIDQTPLTNLDGLINIMCDKLSYDDINSDNWHVCVQDSNAGEGSYTFGKGNKASYTFSGTKVHAVMYRKTDSAVARISVDNKFVTRIDLKETSNHPAEIVYSSEDLPFGEHTIEIAHDSDTLKTAIIIKSLIIDPLPKVGGYKLGYENRISETGTWAKTSDDTPVFSSNTEGATITFAFHGTRFWLTGLRDADIGDFALTIDGNNEINVNERVTSGSNKNFVKNSKSVLLYESPIYELKDHTVTIKRTNCEVKLVNLLYSTLPHNGVYVGVDEMRKKGSWEPEKDGGYFASERDSSVEYSRYSKEFWILGDNSESNGAIMNVYLNEQLESTVNTSEIKTEANSNDILLSHTSTDTLSNYHIKYEHGGSSEASSEPKPLHINYCYYSNDEEIAIDGETETISASSITNKTGTWKEVDNILYSDNKGSSITVDFSGCLFYITGPTGPYYGDIDVSLDGQEVTRVSLYREKDSVNSVVYKSAEQCGIHTLTITSHDDRPIGVYQIKYRMFPSDQSVLTNLDGLINITCDKLEYSGDEPWRVCIKQAGADLGSYNNRIGAKASYTFKGTKVHVVATRGAKSTFANIFLDNQFVRRVNLKHPSPEILVAYSSEDLPFGEHTIDFVHDGEDKKSVIIQSFIVDPLPKVGGYKLGYEDKIDEKGVWVKTNDGTPIFSSSTVGAYITFAFHGTRFWLTGVRESNVGELSIKIDENDEIVVDQRIIGAESQTAMVNNLPSLLFESPVYELKDHFVTIKLHFCEVKLVNLLYSTQPHNGVYVGVDEMEKKGSWEPEESGDGYYSKVQDSSVEYSRYSKEFWILGDNSESNGASMNVYVNEQLENTINTNEVKTKAKSNDILLSHISTSTLSNYHIKYEHGGSSEASSEPKPLHINYCYYSNDEEIAINQLTYTININDMTNRTGTWQRKNAPYKHLYTNEKNSSITVEFHGSRFWLLGPVGPYFGTLDIFLDSEKFGTISLYKEKPLDKAVYYESPYSTGFGPHTLTLTNRDGKYVSIHKIKYNPLAPTFVFSRSEHFSESSDFSRSQLFTKTQYFSSSVDFTYSSDFTSSFAFSKTNDFTYSSDFTSSFVFSKTNDFSSSVFFSESNDFSKSDVFRPTFSFSKSDDFSQSTGFTKSNAFMQTGDFTNSGIFSNSFVFSQSDILEPFSDISSEASFSESDESSSVEESSSNEESPSVEYSPSDEESPSVEYSPSDEESPSAEYSPSDEESPSVEYSPSDEESPSVEYSPSDEESSSSEESPSVEESSSNEESPSVEESSSSEESSPIEETSSSEESPSNEETSSLDESPSVEEPPIVVVPSSPSLDPSPAVVPPSIEESKGESLPNPSIAPPLSHKPSGEISTSGNKKNLGLIIGLVVGIIVLLLIIILIIIIILRKRKKEEETESENSKVEMTAVSNGNVSLEDGFSNPLYNNNIYTKDPFDQEFEEDI